MGEKVAKIVTERILARLKDGVVPWHKPWINGLACNLVSGKPYTGMNQLLLGSDDRFNCPYWLTRKQITSFDAIVNDNEYPTPIVFVKRTKYKDKETGDEKNGRIMRFYRVWNVEQTFGISHDLLNEFYLRAAKSDDKVSESADCLVHQYITGDGPELNHGGGKACYIPSADVVKIPDKNMHTSHNHYYSTLFHELCHSTGHEKRLNRDFGIQGFGDTRYDFEELVAEVGASLLCAEAGVENKATADNTAAYVQSWLKVFEDKPDILLKAATKAFKAVQWIKGEE